MPSIDSLIDLYDNKEILSSIVDDYYWSVTNTTDADPDYAQIIDFNNGVPDYGEKIYDSYQIRCVRDGTPDSVVIDSSTDLMWQDSYSYDQEGWNTANTYCNDLVLEGFSNWRLPSEAELADVYDRATIFNIFSGTEFWTSTEDEGDYSLVDFYDGDIYVLGPSYGASVRCIRDQ